MIQMAQVASLFTLFTHHAKTTVDLVKSLRNNLLQTGVFTNEKIAEQQVADVVNFDIHMNRDLTGHRYIERITEIIPVDDTDYPEIKFNDDEVDINGFLDIAREFFTRMTDRKVFETRDIIVYENGEYKVCSPPSKKQINAIMNNLTDDEKSEFKSYLTRYFNRSEV
ncbi:CpaF/VirB11 family protein [Thermoclostridium stercorarium]|nr:CpaF/VirB11 family protein [Thermoclostridium stercorarium]